MKYPQILDDDRRTLWSDARGKILFVVASGWFLSVGVRLVYPVLLPYFRTTYGFDFAVAGLLLTVLWVAYALGQLPAGILTDRIGSRIMLTLSTLISTVTLALVVTADSPLVLFGVTGLFGFGTAFYGISRFTLLSDTYPQHEGTAISVMMAAGDVGCALLPPVTGLIAAAFAWQYSFILTVPLFAIVTVVLWTVIPVRTSRTANAADTISFGSIRTVFSGLRESTITLVVVIQVLAFSIWQAVTGFYPIYLVEIKGFSPPVATGLYSLFFGLGIVVKPLSGSAYDQFGIRRTLPVVMSVLAVALVILPVVDGFWIVTVVTVLLSSLLGYGAITLSYLTVALPPEIKGAGLGLIRTGYMLIGACSPVLFGMLANQGLFSEGFWILAVVAVVIIVISFHVPNR